MKYKVGDKVKVLEGWTQYTGRIGIIYEVRGEGRTFKYAAYFDGNRWDWQPFRPSEIEKVPEKGKQLLFSFMDSGI